MNALALLRPIALATVFALAGGVSLSSCDKDVVLKTLDVKLTTNLVLNVSGSLMDPLAAVWIQELDPNANIDVRENRSKIKKVVVERFSYRVNQFIGTAGTKGSGTWKFYLTDAPTQVFTLGTVSDLDLQALDTADTVQELPLAEDAKAKLVDAVNSNRKVTFVFDGSVTERPSYTRFEVQVFTKIDVGV